MFDQGKTVPVAELPGMVGKQLEPSEWFEVSQERVNQFADATNDHQFIHIDPKRAKQTPFGGPIAHGFLTLSLLPYLNAKTSIVPEGVKVVVNYGSDKVRYLAPVPVGARIRTHQKVAEVTEKKPGQWLVKNEVTVEIEGVEKPALIAEILFMYFV